MSWLFTLRTIGGVLLIGAAAIFVAPSIVSASEGGLVGEWKGVTSIRSLPQHVKIIVRGPDAGAEPNELVMRYYDSPRVCEMQARFVSRDKATFSFSQTGGDCKHMAKLSPIVRLRFVGDGLEYRLSRADEAAPEEVGYLTRGQ